MANRRFQNPRPMRRGKWWTVRIWKDHFNDNKLVRKQERIKLAPASKPEREVLKILAERLRPLNQGLESIGSATNFATFVHLTYRAVDMPLLAKTTQDRYAGVIDHYLLPAFGGLCLRDLTPLGVQKYFSGLAGSGLAYESKDKIRDVLSSILRSAKKYGLLVSNPVEGVMVPRDRHLRRAAKPHITPEQFWRLLELIPEPYATMTFVAVYSGLRVSELIGLRWEDIGPDWLNVDERYCRGDWDRPKSAASSAAVSVDPCVIGRIHQLKTLTVKVRAGRAIRTYKVVKSDLPADLVFQSVKAGRPMRDNNILTRFLKPAARKLGLPFVNWRCLRTSYATWMVESGANVKDVQGQMRHSRVSTTLDVYAQFVPDSQRRAVARLTAMVEERRSGAQMIQ